ncbi:MAG: hypothetical protein STHCBS139747_005675 [Sporothrix thermara]
MARNNSIELTSGSSSNAEHGFAHRHADAVGTYHPVFNGWEYSMSDLISSLPSGQRIPEPFADSLLGRNTL